MDPRQAARMSECPARGSDGTCIAINGELGWTHGVQWSFCDLCFSMGGISTEEGRELRSSMVTSVVHHYSKEEFRTKLRREVLVPLTIKHKAIPLEVLTGDPEMKITLSREVSWASVYDSWRKAESWIADASSLTKSVGSSALFLRRVSRDIKNIRHTSCFGTDLDGNRVAPPCQWLSTTKNGSFCSACRCGERELARLDAPPGVPESPPPYTKLDFPYLECPKKAPGFSNFDPGALDPKTPAAP